MLVLHPTCYHWPAWVSCPLSCSRCQASSKRRRQHRVWWSIKDFVGAARCNGKGRQAQPSCHVHMQQVWWAGSLSLLLYSINIYLVCVHMQAEELQCSSKQTFKSSKLYTARSIWVNEHWTAFLLLMCLMKPLTVINIDFSLWESSAAVSKTS